MKIIIGMYCDSYLFKIKFDLDFHWIDFVFCFMLRVFKLGTVESINFLPALIGQSGSGV